MYQRMIFLMAVKSDQRTGSSVSVGAIEAEETIAPFHDFATMMQDGSITQTNGSTMITYDATGDAITLMGVAPSDLNAHDFQFV